MVDCPTEDVPFREGTFGGAGSVVPIPTPGFPFLALISATSESLTSLPLHPEAKAKPARLSIGGSRLRYWLCPSLKRPFWSGLPSLYFEFSLFPVRAW